MGKHLERLMLQRTAWKAACTTGREVVIHAPPFGTSCLVAVVFVPAVVVIPAVVVAVVVVAVVVVAFVVVAAVVVVAFVVVWRRLLHPLRENSECQKSLK